MSRKVHYTKMLTKFFFWIFTSNNRTRLIKIWKSTYVNIHTYVLRTKWEGNCISIIKGAWYRWYTIRTQIFQCHGHHGNVRRVDCHYLSDFLCCEYSTCLVLCHHLLQPSLLLCDLFANILQITLRKKEKGNVYWLFPFL